MWRSGDRLVMHKSSQLPADVCIKSNQPATGQLQRRLSWYPPIIGLTILASPLIFIIIALILTKKATIYIGLSDEWASKRRKRIAICWLLALATVLIGIAGFWMFVDGSGGRAAPGPGGIDRGGLGCIICLVALVVLIGVAIGGNSAKLVTPAKIDNEYVWLKGVHPDFLAKLPEWHPY